MARDRKCILCETVHVSKQEMDEHMRTMLHHRELEKLKGRDCGHECRVCKVTVVSLTDYASHISSPTHKQNVEAAEQKHAGNDKEEDYFDQALVDLIQKRKEQIRKEKEAAAAKLAKEEEDRKRKEEFQQRLKEAKQRYRLECAWQQPSQGFGGSGQHSSWYRSNRYNAKPGEPRPWHNNRQGKSATWHAQEPPNFQKWASEEIVGGSLNNQEGWNRRQWDQGGFSGNQQSRLPWLSSGGSSNGIYGHNNISQYPQRGRPLSLLGPVPTCPPPPSFFSRTLQQFQKTANDQGAQQGGGLQNGEGQPPESDHNSNKNSKTFGSNPKLDKACRWSPYPVTKGFESVSHKDSNPNSSEKHPKVPKPQKQDKAPDTSAFNRLSRPEQKQGQSTPSVEEKKTHKTIPKTKPRDRSSSGSRSSSAQREGPQNCTSGPSNQKDNKPLLQKDKKMSSVPGLSSGAQLSKASGQAQAQSKPTANAKQSGLSSKAPSAGPLKSNQERQQPETFWKVRRIMLEKRGSLDSSSDNKTEMARHIVEEQQKDHAQSQIGVNKENSCRQNAAKPNLPDLVRPEKPALQSSDSSQFLQSLQVSTSTMESSEPAASGREDEEKMKKAERPTCSVVPDEAMQAVEAGQSSESDTSRSGEVPTVSGSNTTSLSKLDLPPVLKRDLTKHISSKSKTGNHEPNLNIARRVRNLSESRRSDTEKDSGLKPTVRQLISSSGSRRNVNWEQVYQEVRKKQDKGKGMPRFGIEMVPNEQEDHSQEEDDIPLLEGLHWESLIDISSPGASRKRSLSESSLAPASAPSLFTSLLSKEMAERESLSSEQQVSSVSPALAQGNKDSHCQQQVEQMLGQFEAKAQKQPDKLTSASVKALQRSDSVLGDSSSGTEQFDGQGTGKRRRAAGDAPSAETSCVEHNSKRRRVKSKKERLQIDQLLAVSLREEELSRSLQTVDTSLIQARAALEAAYMEVQRLMVVKQQMTVEMSSLRNKRIELLKGMQGSMEEAPQLKLKEERMDFIDTDPHLSSSVTLSSVTDSAVFGGSPSPGPPAHRASPPSSSLPFLPVVIKQEPQSPVHVSSELDPLDSITHCAHSTTPELPVAPAAASPTDSALSFQPSPERKPELYQTHTEHIWENFVEPADKDGLSGLAETTEKAIQTTMNCLSPLLDSKSSIKLLSPSRRGSESGSVVDCAATKTFEPPSVPSVLNLPGSPSELSGGKRVRKLKKRKVLKKAQGTEQPESSDTEIDGEPLRPRWLRPRRRPSGGSQVSTSTLPTEDREGDLNMESSEDVRKMPCPTLRPERGDRSSSKHMVELPQVAPAELTPNLDSEENMEVTAACQQPHMDALVPAPAPVQIPDSSGPEPQSLACNEVTSTSDMEICKSSESDMPFPVTLPKITKTSSDASSDHGEDELPTEGAFEGHQEAVNAVQIHNGLLYTCSGDRTVKAFDLVSHKCVGVFEGHSSKVSCLLVSATPCLHHRLYTGSSDQTIRCYSLRTQEFEQQFSLSDRVLCLHSRWRTLYAGLANGTVVTFNLKTNKQMDVFECHGPRAVSCLASSQEGARRILLVGSYDNTISVRDAKNGLLLRTLEGHTKTVLCMKVVNDLVFSGSSDQCVYAHNIHTGELVRVYKGHSHAVTVVSILGKVMVTACLDKLVRVYDLQSHDQLQVYGGHKDMVMCMAIHKNMIYTGCYDGSVQAVKLNLMQNYRCWWHGCSLVFGVTGHLQQHLINDHASTSSQTLKCRWKNCEEFFCARNSPKKGMLMHMRKHAEEEIELEP
ncbi:zinc finger protein 106 [Seriola lalandi dorsalis]|uniref:Zinc finger protein 106 n=1 Tax=Seriola lalandi dorsalis TaxID=1841481 RepID=A0A3B4XEC1_SERLL|nr:zinc finger protein 106 [Seriola lalandi dorsalis]